MDLPSEYMVYHQAAKLARVTPIIYDSCINSCILYAAEYRDLPLCPFCNEARFKPNGKPRRRFNYFPLIPCLQGFFQSVERVQLMEYQSKFKSSADQISDIFDAVHYQKLLGEHVVVDGKELPHRYFNDSRDIALALSTDSYVLYKRRCGPVATPILLMNYNIPPHLRTHQEHVIYIRIIPGPHQPKNLASFLSPLDDELTQLAFGIPTFGASHATIFNLRAYVLFKLGDIIAIQKFLNIKGHNSIFPYWSCKIKAVRGLGKTHYIPLRPPRGQSREGALTRKADELPAQTHLDFVNTLEQIHDAPSKVAKERIAKQTGIRELPGLRRVGSLDYTRCAPWEWFHLLLENVIPNLVDLWTGQFKGLDIGNGEFRIVPHIWEIIGDETTAAVQDIPATFVRVLGNITMNCSLFTAESWCFWFVYLAPFLLENRFPKKKYYTHMQELSNIMKVTLQFRVTAEEVDDIEERLCKWVEKYEKYVLARYCIC